MGQDQNHNQQIFVQNEEKTVSMHYPKTVSLTSLLDEASLWSGKRFIVDPTLNRDLQIFAKEKLSVKEAFLLLVASLETVGLRVIPFEGNIVKIVEGTFLRTRV